MTNLHLSSLAPMTNIHLSETLTVMMTQLDHLLTGFMNLEMVMALKVVKYMLVFLAPKGLLIHLLKKQPLQRNTLLLKAKAKARVKAKAKKRARKEKERRTRGSSRIFHLAKTQRSPGLLILIFNRSH